MSVITWIILGLVAGFVGSKLVNRSGEGIVLDIILGIVGGLVGGFLFSLLGADGNGVNLYGSFEAVIGAVVVLFIYHALFNRRAI